jgi:hypothetical protein
MSDCGVCIDAMDCDFDGDLEFSSIRIVKSSRKRTQCSECSGWIEVGESYQSVTGKNDDFWTFKTCLVCAEIRVAFSCNGEVYGGVFWDSMEYCFEALTTGCFDRLETPQAKAELQRRWMQWKGLA